ncbi:MAG: hypothetical protein MJ249_10270 [Kiritimatiellae bacterium]|nr:hypothetical protein [Kiritimatiellia bacterium]
MADINTLISGLYDVPSFNDVLICQFVNSIVERIDESLGEDFINRRIDPESVPGRFASHVRGKSVERLKAVVERWNKSSMISTHRLFSAAESKAARVESQSRAMTADDLKSLQAELKSAVAERDRLKAAAVSLESERDAAQAARDEAKSACDEVRTVLAKLKGEVQEYEMRISAAESEVARWRTAADDAAVRINALKEDLSKAVSERAQLTERIGVYSDVLSQEMMDILQSMSGLKATAADLRVFFILVALLTISESESKSLLLVFDRLDAELYVLYSDAPDELEKRRQVCKTVLESRFPGYVITWDLVGSQYCEDFHSTNDTSGNTVTAVVSALVTQKETGRIFRRAKVRTI